MSMWLFGGLVLVTLVHARPAVVDNLTKGLNDDGPGAGESSTESLRSCSCWLVVFLFS